jgi:hypothetical protein
MVYLAAFREDGVVTSIYNKVKEGAAPQYLYNTETKEAGEEHKRLTCDKESVKRNKRTSLP